MKDRKEKNYLSAGKFALCIMLFATVLVTCNRTGITDEVLPKVISTNPEAEAAGVALDAKITATFSEEMDTTTFNSSSFRLTLNDSLIPGIVSVTPNTATFVPRDNLIAERTYTATITTDVTDAMGYNLGKSYKWSFSTMSRDSIPKIEIISTTPPDQSTEVDTDITIVANFNEEMNPETVNAETFTLRQGTNSVTGSVSVEDTAATFTPSENLDPGVTYTATITTGAESINGYNLTENYSWNFTTAGNSDDNPPDDDEDEEQPDNTPPEVTATDPPDDVDNVDISTTISATFSEAINPATISEATFILAQGDNPVTGSVEYSGSTATFIPDSDLSYNQTYTATITDAVQDIEGNNLRNNVEWQFTTEERVDLTPPEVSEVIPGNNESNVSISTNVSATFNEDMNPATINTSTFVLRGDNLVEGTVQYSNRTAVFIPNNDLSYEQTYTATITTGAEDPRGNNLASNIEWQFTTTDAPDTTPPQITGVAPNNGETGVSITTEIRATFSEAMDPATINASTFTLQGQGTIGGTVQYSGNTATFIPNGDLAYEQTYTVTITTGATDAAGNNLGQATQWTFTTEEAPDTTPPQVTSVNPANAATNVSITAKISATFSEAMDPATINASTFMLQGQGAIGGTVQYSGTTATFIPNGDLAYEQTYTATITTGATDAAGNNLDQATQWIFTTEEAPDTTPPQVTNTSPPNAATNVDTTTSISVTFSETMNPTTINTSSFILQESGPGNSTENVPGTVDYSGVTATFIPSGTLSSGTTYFAIITTEAEDTAGNSLTTAFQWQFQTESNNNSGEGSD